MGDGSREGRKDREAEPPGCSPDSLFISCMCQVRPPPKSPSPILRKQMRPQTGPPDTVPRPGKMSCVGLSPNQQLKCASNQLFTNQQDAECGRARWAIPSASPCESNTDVQTFHSLVQKSLADLAHKCGYNSPEPNTRKSDPMLCERVDAPEPNWVHSRNGEMFSQWKFYQSKSLH